jgi:hypothetical protein
MAPKSHRWKAAERCAAIPDAEQKGNEAASLPRPSKRRRPVAFPAKGDVCGFETARPTPGRFSFLLVAARDC